MATLRHHPQHLRILVLTQTYRTGRVLPGGVPVKLEPRIGVNDVLIETHRNGLLVFIFGHEDDTWQDDTIRVGSVVGGVVVAVAIAVAVGAAAEVGGEDEGGEEDEESEGNGYGVAKAKVVGEVIGGGGWRGNIGGR